MARQYIYVSCFGGLWRLSKRAYGQYRNDRLAGKETDLDDYGKFLATKVINVTDEIEEI